ncbi:hypothetical protein [Pseudomonas sp. NPDC087336]|uniref:hypothetical protein n=1 Tax=Pseudomonas sp. NPDC087336 TaxID=3364436 RepID=UPI003811CA4E
MKMLGKIRRMYFRDKLSLHQIPVKWFMIQPENGPPTMPDSGMAMNHNTVLRARR